MGHCDKDAYEGACDEEPTNWVASGFCELCPISAWKLAPGNMPLFGKAPGKTPLF